MTILADKVFDYLNHLETIGHAPSAIRAYKSRLIGFLTYIHEFEVDEDHLVCDQDAMQCAFEKYSQYLRSEGLRASSVNSIHTTINSFCAFLGMRRLSLARQCETRIPPRSLNTEQLFKLYETICSESNPRDKAIAMLILRGGLRPSECAALNTDEISIQNGSCIICTGRATKSRIISLDAAATSVILDHLQSIPLGDIQPLFVSKFGTRISVGSIDLILKNIGRRARLEISAQLLRETFITQLVSSGIGISAVAALGGTRLDSLKRYYPQSCEVGTPLMIPVADFGLGVSSN